MIKISVVIPSSIKHYPLIKRAVASCYTNELAESEIEVIVVGDHPDPHPLVQINRVGEIPYGPGKCRNLGTERSSGECVAYLDADDCLIPGALDKLWLAYEETGCIVYGDVIRSDTGYFKTEEPYLGINVDPALTKARRPITCLYPKTVWAAVGGWAENLRVFEDVEFEVRTRVGGFCDYKINYPIYWYNIGSGERRRQHELDTEVLETARKIIYNTYNEYYKGEKQLMACGTCGSARKNLVQATVDYSKKVESLNVNSLLSNGYVLELEYIGPDSSVKVYPGPATGIKYRFGQAQPRNRIRRVGGGKDDVTPADAQAMIKWRRRSRGEDFYLFKLNILEPEITIEPPPAEVEAVGAEVIVHKPIAALDAEQQEFLEQALKARLASRIKPVSEFSIAAMRTNLLSATEDEIKIWLDQEQHAEIPRKGMINLLESVLPQPSLPDFDDLEEE